MGSTRTQAHCWTGTCVTLSDFACLAPLMLVVLQVWYSDRPFVSGPVRWYLVQDIGDDLAKLLLYQLELAVVDLSLSILSAPQTLHPINFEPEH